MFDTSGHVDSKKISPIGSSQSRSCTRSFIQPAGILPYWTIRTRQIRWQVVGQFLDHFQVQFTACVAIEFEKGASGKSANRGSAVLWTRRIDNYSSLHHACSTMPWRKRGDSHPRR